MVYFTFSVSIALILFYLILEPNGTSSQTPRSCGKTSGPYNKDKDLAPEPPASENSPTYYLHECDEQSVKIRNGLVIPLFHMRYTVSCKKDFALPLGSSDNWECRSARLDVSNKSHVGIPKKNLRVSECTEKLLPTKVYVERGVYVHDAVNCDSSRGAYIDEIKDLFNTAKTFLIQGLEFFLQLVREQSKCLVSIRNDSCVFIGWKAHLKFRLEHTPKYTRLTDSVFADVNCWLETAITDIMIKNRNRHPGTVFELEKPESVFHAGPCSHPGYIVDWKYKDGFRNDIPLCQTCMRGFYLNKTLGICIECAKNYYASRSGMTSCQPCPSVYETSTNQRGGSVLSCYDWVTTSSRDTVFRGAAFMFAFHATYVAILAWNIRNYIQANLTTGRRDDDQI